MSGQISVFRKIIIGEDKSWVAFENGTCVIVMKPLKSDLAEQAKQLLREYGPVKVGTSAADFEIITLDAAPGWVVGCHHPDILNYVSPDDFANPKPEELQIGLLGRSNRDADAKALNVVHIEDRRRGQ